MKIQRLDDYSAAEWSQAKSSSPALIRIQERMSTGDPILKIRHTAWLECAMATLLKSAHPQLITEHWSRAADTVLQAVWRECGLDQLPAVLLALGKLGAQELNLSSDVDLVIVASPEAIEQVHLKLRQFQKRLGWNESADCLFRVDFDLRPGGRFGPMISTPEQLRDYYWSQGETWERLAWVRARAIAGPQQLVNEIFESIVPFCYRRFLDFSVTEDLKLLRHRIHAANVTPPGKFHLKLGPGGIRDIELFIHSLLIIHAGRRPELRTHSTTVAVENLQGAGLLPAPDAQFLLKSYWQLRQWENTVQAADDQQIHLIDLQDEALLEQEVLQVCQMLCRKVDQLVSTLLGPVVNDQSLWPSDETRQMAWLMSKGISAETARDVWPALLSAVALSGKTERDELARRQFLGLFVEALHEHSLDADLGLKTLLDFVRSVRAKATLFTLLLREPKLIRDLANLFSVSPYLGQMISARPELLDSFLSQRTVSSGGTWETFLEELVERKQLGELLAAGQFLHSRDVLRFGRDLSETADQICQDLLARLKAEIGPSTLHLVALGKWGGRELGARSDLDFILLTEQTPTETDHRIARRLISRLTENHRGGRLYSIDLRLRPSGHAGPLLQSKGQLIDYLKTKAAAWERQSYLRARTESPELFDKIRNAISGRPFTEEDKAEWRQIRDKLQTPPHKNIFDLKTQKGGLIHLEFTVQIEILLNSFVEAPAEIVSSIEYVGQKVKSWKEAAPRLQRIYLQLRLYEQLQQLTSFHSGSQLDAQSEEFGRLARLLRVERQELLESIESTLQTSTQLLAALDPLAPAR